MAAEVSLLLEGNQVNENWGKKSCTLDMELLHPGTYSEAAAREMAVTICWLLLNKTDQQERWLMLKKPWFWAIVDALSIQTVSF